MRKNRILTAAVAAVAAVALMAGCSSGTPTTGSTGSVDDTPVTLRFATNQIGSGAGTSPAMTKLIEDFQAENPNITIELELAQGTELQPLIQVAFASNNVPDVFNFWRPQPAFNMDKYIASGLLADLTPMVDGDKAYRAQFAESSWTTATVDGKVWGLPLINFSVPLLANEAVFKDAGVPLPTTWELLVSGVEALKAKGVIPFTVSTMPASQSCDRLFDYVMDRSVGNDAALDLFRGKGSWTSGKAFKAIEDYMSVAVGSGASDAAALDDNGAIAKYLNTGQSAMVVTNSGYLPSIDPAVLPNMTVVPFPLIPGGAQKETHMEKDLTTLLYASAKSMEDPAKAAAIEKLLKYLTSLEAQTAFADAGILVPAIDLKVDEAATGPLFAELQKIQAELPGDKWLGNGRTPEQQQTFYPLMCETWTGKYTAKEFAQALEDMFTTK